MANPAQLNLRIKAPAYARPTMELGTAAGVLHRTCPGITEDQIRQLIERGAFWAWNVALSPTGKIPELRLLSHSVAAREDVAELLEDPYRFCQPQPETADQAISLLMAALHSSKPWVTGNEVQLLLGIRRTHIIELVDAKALPQFPGTQYRPGPNGYPLIARETLTQFLKARIVC